MKSAPTIYDIANEIGVSTGTVSRAINNDPKIAVKTVNRVRAAMKQLNYVPKPQGKRTGMRSRRKPTPTGNIAFLTYPDAVSYPGIFQELDDFARSKNKNLFIKNLSFHKPLDMQSLMNTVDGVILSGLPAWINKNQMTKPCVQILGLPHEGLPYWDHFTYDNDMAGRIAAQYLIERGKSKVALFYHEHNHILKARAEAFIDEFNKSGKVTTFPIHGPSRKFDNIEKNAKAFIKNFKKFDAAGFINDHITMRINPILLNAGIKLVRDIETISTDNLDGLLGYMSPRPATVDIRMRDLSLRAIDQLMWRIENPHEQPITMTASPIIIPSE
jgi:LacI family transcriptional regulator, galactose operon repressor